jgi:hypothetical protein
MPFRGIRQVLSARTANHKVWSPCRCCANSGRSIKSLRHPGEAAPDSIREMRRQKSLSGEPTRKAPGLLKEQWPIH